MTITCEMKMESTDFSIPDTIQPLFEQLQEALLLEIKFKPNLQLPSETQNDEITMGARNGSAHVLRCLKVWYDLPSEVFFIAINLMDRFLTKMKARPKYMECISVSSFYIAATQVIEQPINADHLVSISQCKCTGSDLNRMSEVIRNKLEWAPGTQPITSFTFLKLFNDIFYKIASHLNFGDLYNNLIMKSELFLRLEMVACDGGCASYKPSEIALVLLFSYLNSAIKQLNTKNDSSNSANQMLRLIKFITEMQKICQITDVTFLTCQESVEAVLSKYNAQEQTPHRQRLIWKLSSRTARLLRPTDKFTSVLPVIAENTTVPSSKRMRKNRKFTKIKETFFLHNG